MSKRCAKPRCQRPCYARGLCEHHYDTFRYAEIAAGRWKPYKRAAVDEVNPWAGYAPPCPTCGQPAYFWRAGPLCWCCPPCGRRFDVAAEAAA